MQNSAEFDFLFRVTLSASLPTIELNLAFINFKAYI
jgi:hypothetical protein